MHRIPTIAIAAVVVSAFMGSAARVVEPALPSWPFYTAGALLGALVCWLVTLLRPLYNNSDRKPQISARYLRLMHAAFAFFCIALFGFVLAAHGHQLPGIVLTGVGVFAGLITMFGMFVYAVFRVFRRQI